MSYKLRRKAERQTRVLQLVLSKKIERSDKANAVNSTSNLNGSSVPLPPAELRNACNVAVKELLSQRVPGGWWEGHLSTSALSTATAVMALQQAVIHECKVDGSQHFPTLISNGLEWLANHQNDDGGWGDTVLSVSNISTTMLANAVFHATKTTDQYSQQVQKSQAYIDAAGGVPALMKRYGKDHTFSVPILTHCALAEIVDWKEVTNLPFEMSCVPSRFYAAIRMPVVSYALPALIAIGQVIFHHKGHWNPFVKWIRRASIGKSMRVLESIQPEHGGFLEATPLTSFVCMSLLGCGHGDHIVTERCLRFIVDSVREDGSWPIDTNLTTWVSTLAVNALTGNPRSPDRDDFLNLIDRDAIGKWLRGQQYRTVHPYTNAAPGGWSWTDLPGGVPDADDTPGAMLAVLNLRKVDEPVTAEEVSSLEAAAVWLLDLQNSDGGWPTFCKGWGTLPFDRSSNDLTAHTLRALAAWQCRVSAIPDKLSIRAETAIAKGLRYLEKQQNSDGSWLPLWFGHQFAEDDENRLYGTAKVVLALNEIGQQRLPMTEAGLQWLLKNQNDDGGWSASKGLTSSCEETGLALEAIAFEPAAADAVERGTRWLVQQVNSGAFTQPTPIGFYFAKLWYFERLYPVLFTVSALRRCLQR